MMPLALLPRALARVMYSDLGMVDLGRPRNSLIMSNGNATSPAPQKIMNNSHPAAAGSLCFCNVQNHPLCLPSDFFCSWLNLHLPGQCMFRRPQRKELYQIVRPQPECLGAGWVCDQIA